MSTQPGRHSPELLPTLARLLLGGTGFRAFPSLLRQGDLLPLLGDTGPYTVFAPVDSAFSPTARAQLGGSFDTVGGVRRLVLNHVVKGALSLAQLRASAGTSLTTMAGSVLPLGAVDGALRLAQANVFATDFEARNGVIHLVDGLLLPLPLLVPTEARRWGLAEPPRG